MADEVERKDGGAGRIEGGVDAIVVGANADGLTAAGYLGKAGLKTVVLDSSLEVGGLIQERVFDDGRSFLDGDRLLNILDAAAVADLELYRHGLSYAARRLATTYFFKSGDSIELPGDLQAPAQNSTDFDVKGFTQFVEDVFDTASYLRPAFESSIDKQSNVVTLDQLLHDASADFAERIKKFTVSDAQSIIEKYVATQSLQSALISETVFRQENSPQDAFSFMALVRRWAGEIAGLQGAIGYPAG
ncbi:MAG: NAD(P)-binding protein, partial [Marinicaulis sp.]|nr:NAD(P)-binding protein [Marinicaulis sp.]